MTLSSIADGYYLAANRLITAHYATNLIILIANLTTCLQQPISSMLLGSNVPSEIRPITRADQISQVQSFGHSIKFTPTDRAHDLYIVPTAAGEFARPEVAGLTLQRNRRFSVLFWQSDESPTNHDAVEFMTTLDGWRNLRPHRMHQCNASHCHRLHDYQPLQTFCVHVDILEPNVMITGEDARTLRGFDIRVVELFARLLHCHLKYVCRLPLSNLNNLKEPGFRKLGNGPL